jgi:hypothetical protein
MHADERQELDVIYAGEIGATVGLKGTSTGHTLCAKEAPVILEKIVFDTAVFHLNHHSEDSSNNINDYYIEFWMKNTPLLNNIHIDCDEDEKEMNENTLSIRRQGKGDIGQLSVDEFIRNIVSEIEEKKSGE